MFKLFTFIIIITAFSIQLSADPAWTVMIFMNGDNNLDSAGNNDLEEMMKIGSSENLNILVLQDHEGADNTERHIVHKDKTVTEKMGEIDFGDWREALQFFIWGTSNFPAEHYFFTIWNHGSGWENRRNTEMIKAISLDDHSGHSIKTTELHMLSKAMFEHLGRRVDVLGYDACLMAMAEIAWESKDYADYMVFSEETEPGDGWPYDDILSVISENPAISPAEFVRSHVEKYLTSYSGGSQGNKEVTQSSVDLSELRKLTPHLNSFCNKLISDPENSVNFRNIFDKSLKFYYSQYRDLCDILLQIKQSGVSPDSVTASENLLKHLKQSTPVITAAGGTQKLSKASGLSIYFPTAYQYSQLEKEYLQISFAKDTRWDELLSSMFHPAVPELSLHRVIMHDQNGDDVVTPGEKLSFSVEACNEGSKPCENAVISVICNDQNIDIINQSLPVSVGAQTSTDTAGLAIKIHDSCPGDYRIELSFIISWGNKKSSFNYSFIVRKQFSPSSRVLLVMRDAGHIYTKYFVNALKDAGIPYDTWDMMYNGKLDQGILNHYKDGMVFMNFTNSNDTAAVNWAHIGAYLSSGGALFISGQDVANELQGSDFLRKYLHAEFIGDNTGIFEISGKNSFSDISFRIKNGDGAANQNWPDEVDPIDPGTPVFLYKNNRFTEPAEPAFGITSSGTAGIYTDTGIFRVLYLSFGFEGINGKDTRAQILKKAFNMLVPAPEKRLSEFRKYLESSKEKSSALQIEEFCRYLIRSDAESSLLNSENSIDLQIREHLRELKNSFDRKW